MPPDDIQDAFELARVLEVRTRPSLSPELGLTC
jgi:hypothetical protein